VTASTTSSPAPAAAAGPRAPTRRNAELALLLFAMGVVTVYAAAVEYGVNHHLGRFWLLPLLLTLVFLAMHLAVRFLAPYADPAIVPAVALLNGLGVVFLRRIDLDPKMPDLDYHPNLVDFGGIAFKQLIWTVAAVIVATVALVVVRDHCTLSRYAYTLGFTGLVLLMISVLLLKTLIDGHWSHVRVRFVGCYTNVLVLVF